METTMHPDQEATMPTMPGPIEFSHQTTPEDERARIMWLAGELGEALRTARFADDYAEDVALAISQGIAQEGGDRDQRIANRTVRTTQLGRLAEALTAERETQARRLRTVEKATWSQVGHALGVSTARAQQRGRDW